MMKTNPNSTENNDFKIHYPIIFVRLKQEKIE